MMKKLLSLALFCITFVSAAAADLAQQIEMMKKQVAPNTITYKDENNWLYSKNELEHLAKGELANGKIIAVSASRKPGNANPVPALKAFHNDLAALGIKLILLPVPPKLAAVPCRDLKVNDAMCYLKPFYQELRSAGLTVLDISEQFNENSTRYYCRTDAHWSPAGIALAVQMLVKEIPLKGNTAFPATRMQQKISGDLARSLNAGTPETEEITMDTVPQTAIDANSPVLLIGDSHTLIFSVGADMLAENAGLAETLAAKLNTPIDRIGVRGSAATAVRINLFRKAAKDPAWLKNKKYVIYCFSCREFTEAISGWAKIPVLKK